MHSPRCVQSLACLVALAGLFLVTSKTQAQDKGEKVRFTTIDGVEIQGMFYAASKRNAPTVLMLHALDEDSRKKAWITLAEALSEKCAVLTFDFRAHGQSTSIDAQFWKFPRNYSSVKGAGKKESIEFKDMDKSYYPVLVNDIAAAKAFLDNRNDTGACNTSNLIVLGAETGATLGAIWLNAEWHRFAFTPPMPLAGIFQGKFAQTSEGKNTIAAVWLSMTSKLGSRTISVPALLDKAGREHATPMAFIYSDDDKTGMAIAKACETRFKGKKKDDKYRFTLALPVKGGGNLKGASLLQKTLLTEENIVGYINEVAEAKANEWVELDFRKTQYVWRMPGVLQPYPAKPLDYRMLIYDTYEKFLPR
jgi:hypothetical protein